ncbi:MAG: Asp-tRNA(Asn)/Glu-tRNA(Gln) amidotransferase subunit GatA [Elusimicrobiaceae bacterium]|nr:Asp-tRNA(Asn)/Glu-tRNA(Gln) amidotransferase subunit GatA [Elusimicrobiaceae bacterium]
MRTAFETAEAVRAGKLGAEESINESLAAIKAKNGELNAFLEVFEEDALTRARELDAKIKAGKPAGKLAGVPVAIKDNILYEGRLCTCASKILQGHRAVYSAEAVRRLLSEDAVIVGRTNMDEFAMGSSGENSAFGPVRNPLDISRVPGGSSSGSAAAVAAGMVPVALGSDTGGSVRQPGALCGVTALKPSYGRVSRRGLVAFGSSLDQIGHFTADARDSALVLSVTAGHDSGDSTCVDKPVPAWHETIGAGVRGLKIGLPKEYFVAGMDPETEKLVRAAAARLETAGARLVDISLPHTKYAVPVYYIIASSEASSNLARFDGMRYGFAAGKTGASLNLKQAYEKSRAAFGAEVKRRIMLGTYALSSGYYDAYYAKAQRVRTLIKRDFDAAFEKVDVILTPTVPAPAFKIGEKTDDPVSMYLSDIFTIPCNLAGLPGLSVPCGKTAAGLPAGVQFLAAPFNEAAVFTAAQGLRADGAA